MGGKGSGRKPYLERMEQEDISKVCASVFLRFMTNPAVPDERKMPFLVPILIKRMSPKDTSNDMFASNNIVIVRIDGSKTETMAGSVRVQPEALPSDVQQLGDRQVNVLDISGYALQRADTRESRDNLS